MTRQETYERIREFFTRPGAQLAQYRPMGHSQPSCYYRHPDDGRPCAIGCLIPDDVYDEGMEDTTASALVTTHVPLVQMFPWVRQPQGESLMDGFQSAHDGAADVNDFIARLDATAENYGLDVVGREPAPQPVAQENRQLVGVGV